MNTFDHAAKFAALMERLAKEHPEPAAIPSAGAGASVLQPDEPMLGELLRSMLIWECTQTHAAAALRRLEANLVDFNELRVCTTRELAVLLGPAYPCAWERCERLRAALAELFEQRHCVSLLHVQEMGKREALQYLESLPGIPGFVAARVALVHHGNHSMPVDSRVLRVLIDARAMPKEQTSEGAASWIEHKVRGELLATYLRLQARADELPLPSDASEEHVHAGVGAPVRRVPAAKALRRSEAGASRAAGKRESIKK